MTQTHDELDVDMIEEHEPTAAEVAAWQRDALFLPVIEARPTEYPALHNISAGFMFGGVIRPVEQQLPDYVVMPMERPSSELLVSVAKWNMLWEAGQFRRRFFSEDDLAEPMARIADLGDINTTIVPRTRSRYFEYAPLYHLLPKRTVERFGLPLLRRGQWPFVADNGDADRYLPPYFEERLAAAWAWTVWPHLISGSPQRA